MTTLTQSLKNATGLEYGRLLAMAHEQYFQLIAIDFRRARAVEPITPRVLASMALQYDLSMRVICQFLEDGRLLPTGTYLRLAGAPGLIRKAFDAIASTAATF